MCRCNYLTINIGENRAVRIDHKQVSMRRSIFRLAERGLLYLGAFAKLRKATISFVTSVRPSVCPHRRNLLQLEAFSRNLVSANFSKNLLREFKSH